ncbi:uncharacterized protein LOC111289460 isoform X2 [Durio zibethinus]|uniref:Uncharacterized protein LOC111289460 isoform X2 n=1 Tax=Durio zibethinus TaxID=66656 RepID=A0A6P5Y740_DURZI|nr:uncharacterized protein LOC111289460 isoform X2 [Durio zibethinus]
MDAVELNYPVDVPKLMGSEGFGREARASEDCKPLLNSSIDCCTTSLGHKDDTSAVDALDSASWSKIPDSELSRHASQLPSHHMEELFEQHDHRGTSCHLQNPSPDVVDTQRKAGKMTRSSSGCSKRARLAQLEDIMSSAGVDDVKDINDKLESTKCNIPDKTQMSRQKNSFNVKRGDRRNFKVPMKPKFDSFSMKAGLGNFTMASGGNNFLGLYGLKADIHDVTKLVEDLSLNELLDGTYECPSLGKEKGRKAANPTENFLHSIKKDSCSKPDMPANPPDFLLCQPKDILGRLALPPSKDLDSLLLDATKPSSSTRNNSDIRSSKQISRRASLPPFPWSHTFNGCRTNSDVGKLLSNKSTCQGRWVKIPNTFSTPGIVTGCFTNLESLAFDPSLIPSGSKFGSLEGGIAYTGNLRFCEQGTSSLATYMKAFNVPQVGHCPRLLAAAQTLCDIASKSLRQSPDGNAKWPKKPSQKAMKARKTKSIDKPEEIYVTPSSMLGSDKLVRSDMDQIIPSKRSKLSVVENKKDLIRINGVRPIAWSTPRSSRSSPGKSLRDSTVEIRHPTANVLKPPCTMHPPATVSDKPCNSQHKLRKLMPVDWKRGRDRHE